ncbi:MAG: hypothetical protein N2109_11750 [Fimbriimonadales bacterium]|nr:hypothetical protein [Fimbriimonadales bacterium]
MKKLWLFAPVALAGWVGASMLQREEVLGPFRVTPDSTWRRQDGATVFGLSGWSLVRSGAGPTLRLHLAEETHRFEDDRGRERLCVQLARQVGEAHPGGFKADTSKVGGVEAVRAKFVEGEETVWRMFPYNAERVFTVTLVVGKANAAFPDEAKKLLVTLRLPDPPYKPPKQDLLGGLLGALDKFSKQLDELNSVLSGKPPKVEQKPPTTKDPANQGPETGKGNEGPVVDGGGAVAVSVPWIKVGEGGATESSGLARTDRLWAPLFASASQPIEGAQPLALQSDLSLAELAKLMPGGNARVASAALFELAGQLPPADAAKLEAKLAPALARPTPATEKYFERLLPLLQEELSLRAADATAADEFDAAWEEAQVAAALGDEQGVRTALEIADRQRELLSGAQARMAQISLQAGQVGPAPNPVAEQAATAEQYQQDLKAILAAIEEMSKPTQRPPEKVVVWNFSGKVSGNWTVAKLNDGIQLERKKIEADAPGPEHWKSSVTASIRVWLPQKVRGADDKPSNGGEAAQMLQKKLADRECGFVPSDMAVGLAKQGGMEGVSAFAIGEFKGHIVDYAVWRRRGTWSSGYTASYAGAGGEGWVFAEGYRIGFQYQVWTGGCYCNHGLEWENSQAIAVQREARAILAGLNPKGTGVFQTVADLGAGGAQNPSDAIPESLRPTIELHTANIRFIKGTIQRLQEELSREADPSRRAQLELQLVLCRSDLMAEEDLIQSSLTGQIVHRRSPFEEYAQQLFVQRIREDQQRMERFARAQASLQRLAALLPPGEADEARRFIDRQIDRKAMAGLDFTKVSQVAEALNNKLQGYWQLEGAKSEESAAKAQLGLEVAQNLKWVADNSLSVLSIFGGRPLSIAYQAATGYVEGGPLESVLRTAAWCGTPAYMATEALRGFQRGGWSDAAQSAAQAYLIGKAFDWGVRKAASWRTGRAAPAGPTEAQIAEFQRRRATGESTAKRFIEAQKALLEAGKKGASPREIQRLQERAMRAAQAVHEDPHAKNFLKYRGDPVSQRAYNAHLSATHAAVEARFHQAMEQRGWSRAPLKEFRNVSSAGSVGMDYDIGLDEALAGQLKKNGKPASLHRWQREAQSAWDEAYQQVTGRSAKRSWETVTTSQHAEAYKDLEWLSSDKSGIRRAWSQQAADVTRYKNWHMANDPSLDVLTSLQENSRGAAKDIGTKLMDLLKRAKPKNPQSAKALADARQKWQHIQETLQEFGSNSIDPVEASRRIRQITGGRDIPQVLDDAAMMIESLGKHVGK